MNYPRRELLAGAVGAMAAVALLGAGTLVLRNDGIQFPDGSVQQTADPVIADSVGKVVGPIIGFSADTWADTQPPMVKPILLLRHEGNPVVLRFNETDLHVPGLIFCNTACDERLTNGVTWVRRVFHLLADCEGPAYVYWGGWRSGNGFDNWAEYHYAVGFDNKLYRASTSLWSDNVPFQSWGEPGRCTNKSDTLNLALSLEDTGLDLDDLFTPPYHIE